MFPPELFLLHETGAAVAKVLLLALVVVALGPTALRVPVPVQDQLAADGQEARAVAQPLLVPGDKAQVPTHTWK